MCFCITYEKINSNYIQYLFRTQQHCSTVQPCAGIEYDSKEFCTPWCTPCQCTYTPIHTTPGLKSWRLHTIVFTWTTILLSSQEWWKLDIKTTRTNWLTVSDGNVWTWWFMHEFDRNCIYCLYVCTRAERSHGLAPCRKIYLLPDYSLM